MTEQPSFRRGDVVLAVLPYPTDPGLAKVRPVVVIQNDIGNRFSPNLIVAAISSQVPRRQYPTNLLIAHPSAEAHEAGLDRASVVQAEVIATIPKSAIARRIGRFGDATMQAIDRCVQVSLGLT